jgi:hypothetical protein
MAGRNHNRGSLTIGLPYVILGREAGNITVPFSGVFATLRSTY